MCARRLRHEHAGERQREERGELQLSHVPPTGSRITTMTTETMLTPSRVWKKMTLEQRQRAARAFWEDEEAANDQVQAALLIAQQKKFRPKTVVSLDVDRKARHLASMTSLPDQIAARALVLYHLSDQRAMMGRFLDALGIAHENGLIKEDNVVP